jgi:hypothetical protein
MANGTLLYRVYKLDTVTMTRTYETMLTVPGRRFSPKSDRLADEQCLGCSTDAKTGHLIERRAERFDREAMDVLAETLEECAKLIREIQANWDGSKTA